MRRLRGVDKEAGVAMVTVIFIGAALTAITSVAAFATVQSFRATRDDRNSASALAYAEAGIDRLMQKLRDGSLEWAQILRSGCNEAAPVDPSDPTATPVGRSITVSGRIGNGSFSAVMKAYVPPTGTDPAKFAPDPAACPATPPSPKANPYFAITSTGAQPSARRVVRQILRVGGTNLPVGIFANDVDAGGGGEAISISLISDGSVRGRDKMHFAGADPWYVVGDFYPGAGTSPIPAAVHTTGSITLTAAGAAPEHLVANPNCDRRTNGATSGGPGDGQSVWDADVINPRDPLTTGCANWVGAARPTGYTGPAFPPRSTFTLDDLDRVASLRNLTEEDYANVRESARSTGLYCVPDGNGVRCLKKGTETLVEASRQITTAMLAGMPKNYVIYMDFPKSTTNPFSTTTTVNFTGTIGACPDKVVTVVVRYGSMQVTSAGVSNGAFLVPEGELKLGGSATIEGTIIAKKLTKQGGSTVKLSQCWVDHMPGPWLSVSPTTWIEVDR